MVPHVFASFKRKGRTFVEMRWRKVYESVQMSTNHASTGRSPWAIC